MMGNTLSQGDFFSDDWDVLMRKLQQLATI